MRLAPIPQRIPPLVWRGPAFIWTPLALIAAVGGPALVFGGSGPLAQLALIAGAVIYALALSTLGAAWALGRPPRTRREVVLHVLAAGAIAALLIPFALTELLALVANYEQAGAGEAFTTSMALSILPLTFLLGLPITLVTSIAFSYIALERPRSYARSAEHLRHDVQPFR